MFKSKKGLMPFFYLFLPNFLLTAFFTLLSLQSFAQDNFPLVSEFDPNRQNVLAFPGAEGFGRYASGGRGGQVIKVTNLNDSGPGSLRDALGIKGPKIIVFDVSGTIKLSRPITVKESNLTIAGQTAPGDGITISNYWINFIDIENVIIRFLRFISGDTSGEEGNPGYGAYMKNIIFDHCTFSWGTDEIASFYAVKDFTLQWCVISEALNNSIHPKGPHGYASITGGKNVSWHHNLIAHATQRMVRFDHPGIYSSDQAILDWRGNTDFRNNVIYNWQQRASSGGEEGFFNVINNYYRAGPSTEDRNHFLSPIGPNYGKFFVSGNILHNNSSVNTNNWEGVKLEDSDLTERYLESTKLSTALASDVYEFNHSALEAYQKTLDFAGASLVRDPVDLRIVQETRNGTFTFNGSNGSRNGIIDSQRDVGGWPVLKTLPAPLDTDGDGMPDAWESANGLNPSVSNDKEYNLSPYYTDIEVYINSLVQGIIDQKNPVPPVQVKPLLPASGATVSPVDVSFAWSTSSTAKGYRLQVSKSSDFSSNVITIDNILHNSFVRNQLDANTTYFWRARGFNNYGNAAYSTVGSFRTGSLTDVPGRPLILSPQEGAINVSVTPELSWTKVPNAKSYRIQVSTSNTFSTVLIDRSGLTDSKFSLGSLNENTNYFWRVRAVNESGSGSYSLIGSFKTASFGTKPLETTLKRPAHTTTVYPVSIRLEWEPNPTAQEYRLQVSTSSSFSSYIINRSGIKDTHFTIDNLNSNGTYYWKVIAINRSGTSDSVLPYMFRTSPFDTPPSNIRLVSPANDVNIFSTTIQFSWEEPTAKSFRLQISTRSDFSSLFADIQGITGNSRSVSGLSARTKYFWRVIPSNEAGTGPASETRIVTSSTYSSTPGLVTRIGPTDKKSVPSNNVQFNWQNEPSTQNYRIQVSTVSNFSTLVVNTLVPGTSFEIQKLNNFTTYYWRIRGQNPLGVGSYSTVWSFRTESESNTPEMNLVSPSNDATLSSNSVDLVWQTYPNAQQYALEVSESDRFSSFLVNQAALLTTSFELRGIPTNVKYYWRVSAVVNGIKVASSEISTFTFRTVEDIPESVGLVGHWKMEEGSGMTLTDHSGLNNHGTLQNNSSVNWVAGKDGKAISLPGSLNRFATVRHQSSLSLSNAITISAWIRPNDVHLRRIISKTNPNGFEFGTTSGGKIEFIFNRSSAGSTYRLTSATSFPADGNTWMHVAATFDGRTSTIYINGRKDVSMTYDPVAIGTNSSDLFIGALTGGGNRWNGLMDDLRLYNRVLTETEVAKLAQNQFQLQTRDLGANLMGHWRLDENGGNRLTDHSGQGNHGTIQNISSVGWVNGKEGLGLFLPGTLNRFATAPHRESLNINAALTISAWIRPSDTHTRRIISKTSPNGFELGTSSTGQVEFAFNTSSAGQTYRLRSRSSYAADGNTWTHVAATFDGTKSILYINGVEDTRMNYSPTNIGTNTSELYLGALQGGNNRWFGALDDIRLYNTDLAPSEVLALFSSANASFRTSSETYKGATTATSQAFEGKATEEISPDEIKVFPNPVEDRIFVELGADDAERILIKLYDMFGREIIHRTYTPENGMLELNLQHLGMAKGKYVLVVQVDFDAVETFKIIKK